MADFEDYYEILQVHLLAEPEIIEAAYKRLAQKYHPDKNKSSAAAEQMKKINRAHDLLSDPDKRRQYDSEWTKRKQGPQRPTSDKPKPTVEPNYIQFTDVKPNEVKLASFLILNAGGSYKKIWFSNPQSWVRIVNYFSLTNSDELPLKVEIAAEGYDWNKDYLDYIKVRLDDEETQVRIELRTEKAPASPPARRPRKRNPDKSIWWKVIVGAGLVILIIFAVAQFMHSPDAPANPVMQNPAPPTGIPANPTQAPAPSSVPKETKFEEIDISTIANHPSSSGLPHGEWIFYGVNFNILEVFMTEYGAAPLPVEGTVEMDRDIAHPVKVYVLINTTDTYQAFFGKRVGKIALIFDNGASQETDLFVGQNIREYTLDSLYGNTVKTVTDPNNQVVWQGADQSRIVAIDMLTIPVNLNNQSRSLKQIIITDTSATTTNSTDPGLIVWGITVACNE